MKNIYDILKEFGLEVPEDKKKEFDKLVADNYRTKSDYEKVADKRDEYKESLETTQGKLEAFKDVDVDDLKNQITKLTNDLQNEKEGREADALKVELGKNVDAFLGDKKFVNAITQESIREKLMEELNKDSAKGKSIADIFTMLTSDKDGNQLENILIDEDQQQAQNNKATFTQPVSGKLPTAGTKLSTAELMKLKNQNPDLDISQYM